MALLTLLAGLLAGAVGIVVLVAATDLSVAAARARSAADAAALAAAAESPLAAGGGDPGGAAVAAAAANGARLDSLVLDGWPVHVQVGVSVPYGTPLVQALVSPARARAAAAVHPP